MGGKSRDEAAAGEIEQKGCHFEHAGSWELAQLDEGLTIDL